MADDELLALKIETKMGKKKSCESWAATVNLIPSGQGILIK
jgi:hypothetical protein